ncbi:MAG: HNH endonuclease [Propionibacteriaceae bacterium]|jgi:5-methylcytosine-specific restriction endonuclease McrA|nr:HNH endonuclease [Propionibacteriaceae bacterium]
MTTVLILNAGGQQVLGRVSLKHAIGMLHRRVARVHEAVPGASCGPYQVPRSVELLRYIYTRWIWQATGRTPYSKSAVLRRDNYRCAYCGRPAGTVDHVQARSRGGMSNWLNCVAACFDCNSRKGDRSVQAAGMKLRFQPYEPTPKDLQPDWRVGSAA